MDRKLGYLFIKKVRPLVLPLVVITLMALVIRLFFLKPPVKTRAESEGVGINFTLIEAPLDKSKNWRWRVDMTATRHVGEVIPIQYGVYWCKNSSGIAGEGLGNPCAPDLTPDDFLETIFFQSEQILVQNTTSERQHQGVDCGRIQIDIGGLGGILGGDAYDTGISCSGNNQPIPTAAPQPSGEPQPPGQPTIPSPQTGQADITSLLKCVLFADCSSISESPSQTPVTPEQPGQIAPQLPAATLDYTLPLRDTSIRPVSDAQEIVRSSFKNAKFEYWDLIVKTSIAKGWNPAFVLTLWIEETGASARTRIEAKGAGDCTNCSNGHLGCAVDDIQNINQSLDCLFNNFSRFSNDQFIEFMQSYSGEEKPKIFSRNPPFPNGIKSWYSKLVPSGQGGLKPLSSFFLPNLLHFLGL